MRPGSTGPGAALAIAHRAGNSLTRLRPATELGVDVIEADVVSYPGRLEVRHLKTMGPLPLLWDKWELRSTRTPRLGLVELLQAAKPDVTVMLDLKGRDVEAGSDVARALHEHAPQRPVLVCSRFWPILAPFEAIEWVRTVRSARTRAELAPLLAASTAPGYGASVHRSLMTPDVVGRLHERVDVVMTWPINDDATLEQMLALRETGTIGVISDELDVLRTLLLKRDQTG